MDHAQGLLFRLAVENVYFNAAHEGAAGWRLNVGWRRQGEPWSAAVQETYSSLSTLELVDVLDACIARAFHTA